MTQLQRRNLRDRADRAFSRLVRSRGMCLRCGSRSDLQCCHVFRRGFAAIRWDERNALCLCSDCHGFYTAHPEAWERFCRVEGVPWDDLARERYGPPQDPARVLAELKETA